MMLSSFTNMVYSYKLPVIIHCQTIHFILDQTELIHTLKSFHMDIMRYIGHLLSPPLKLNIPQLSDMNSNTFIVPSVPLTLLDLE